jgi:hypothetical protein
MNEENFNILGNDDGYEEQDMSEFIEIELPDPDAFLKVRETLTRIGINPKNSNNLYQSCHILSKNRKTKYYIVHFKELFILDGKYSNFTMEDKARRNTIANLLEEWGLVKLVDPAKSKSPIIPLNTLKIIPHKEKQNWNLIPKYSIGGYVQHK